jgi:uncharacterized protein (DUF58 family)
MGKTTLITHPLRALLGAGCTIVGLAMLNLQSHGAQATLLAASGALLLLSANPNSLPGTNRALSWRRAPKASPLVQNDLTQIAYDVRHAPRPGRRAL